MAKRKHRWGGAGYVCLACGEIKNTRMAEGECPGGGEVGFDLWLYHAGAGWWLEESGVATADRAAAMLAGQVGTGNTVAGAVLPAGKPLGLFTKQREG